MGRTKRPQVPLYLDKVQADLLAKAARDTGMTQQDLLREAVAQLLRKTVEVPPGYEWVRERREDGRGNRHILRKILPKV